MDQAGHGAGSARAGGAGEAPLTSLTWELDGDVWHADSCIHDEGVAFHYRITAGTRDKGRVTYELGGDGEIVPQEYRGKLAQGDEGLAALKLVCAGLEAEHIAEAGLGPMPATANPGRGARLTSETGGEAEHVRRFVEACLDLSPGAETWPSSMWDLWREWCRREGLKTTTSLHFFVLLRSACPAIELVSKGKGEQRHQKLAGVRIAVDCQLRRATGAGTPRLTPETGGEGALGGCGGSAPHAAAGCGEAARPHAAETIAPGPGGVPVVNGQVSMVEGPVMIVPENGRAKIHTGSCGMLYGGGCTCVGEDGSAGADTPSLALRAPKEQTEQEARAALVAGAKRAHENYRTAAGVLRAARVDLVASVLGLLRTGEQAEWPVMLTGVGLQHGAPELKNLVDAVMKEL